MGAATGYWWQWNITVRIYTMMYLGLGVQKRCPGGTKYCWPIRCGEKGGNEGSGPG